MTANARMQPTGRLEQQTGMAASPRVCCCSFAAWNNAKVGQQTLVRKHCSLQGPLGVPAPDLGRPGKSKEEALLPGEAATIHHKEADRHAHSQACHKQLGSVKPGFGKEDKLGTLQEYAMAATWLA